MSNFEQLREEIASQFEGVNRYNPQHLRLLEDMVKAEIEENKYDLESNLTILKLYQLNPNEYNADVASKVLLKCLTVLPKSDFVLAKCLIDQAHMDEDPVKLILELSDLLEVCNFTNVWALLDVHKDLIEGMVGFKDSIRLFVCHVVNITYQNIAMKTLQELLGNLSEEKVKEIAKKQGWELKEDGYVYIYNHEATVKSRNIEEKFDFSNIQDILRAAA